MPTKSLTVIAAALCLPLSLACATQPADSGTSAPKQSPRGEPLSVSQPFPSQDRLDALSKQPVERPLATVGTMASVTSWSIEPAIPNADWTQPYTGEEPNAAAFAAWLGKTKARSSASMTCVAQQYARFTAENPGAIAGADLLSFMQARCGVPFADVRPHYWKLPAKGFRALDANAPQPEVLAPVQGAAEGALAGLGVWKTETDVVAAVLVAEPPLSLQPLPFDSGETGSVAVQGVYDQPTEWMQASVTHGPLGFKACERVPVTGPKGSFGFRCPTNPSDSAALVEVSAAPKGSVLGRTVARMFVSPDGALPTKYDAPKLELPTTAGDFSSSAVLAGINALRGRAGLPDLMGAPAQDEVSQNLFPHLLNTANPSARNEAALGVIAGWRVEDVVRSGTFGTTLTHLDTPLDQTIASGLFFPSFRAVALGPQTRILSSAIQEDAENSLRGMLHVAFEVFEAGTFDAEESAVYQALDDARAKVALPPVTRVRGGKDEAVLAQSAERIRTGESAPSHELDRMLKHFRDETKRSFYGVIYSPTQIDGWTPEFDPKFFEHEKLAVSVTVSYFNPPGAAWGQHVVFIVFTAL